jgi:signal transduction histidine kinase
MTGAPHPATVVIITLCLLLVVALPALTGAALADRMDRPARLWYAALGLSAAGIVAIAVLQRYSGLTASCMTAAAMLLIASLRSERGLPRLPRPLVLAIFCIYVFAEIVIDVAGARRSAGVVLSSATLAALEAWILVEIYALGRSRKSRGLLLVALGVLTLLVYNASRVAIVLHTGPVPQIFSYAPIANAALLCVPIGIVLLTVGHLIFVLEKTNVQRLVEHEAAARAEERRKASEAHTEELRQIISERDAMVMLNSRFAAVSSLAIYNSAIVHELSQPVQALTSIFDLQALKQDRTGLGPEFELTEARLLIEKMSGTLTSLRSLIAEHEPAAERVDLANVLSGVVPIVRGEAERRQVKVCVADSPSGQAFVLCNKVMLDRIVLNLVSNSLEAIGRLISTDPTDLHAGAGMLELSVEVDRQANQAVLAVVDNGPGFSEAEIENGPLMFKTTRPDGVGLGLALARIILQTWRGELRVGNRPGTRGGRVEVRLPLR